MKIKVPNLSLSRGELPPDLVAGGRSRNLMKQLRAMAGWGALAMGFFLVFAWLALPTQAIAWRIGHEARKAGYKVDIEDLSIYPWGTVTLENVTWTYEPSRPGEPPLKYMMEEVDVSVGLLSLMAGNLDVEVETEREQGRIYARYARASDESTFEIDIEELPLYDVPKATQALGVPMVGLLAVKGELTMEANKWSKAEGEIKLECSGCRAGDGESKLYIPGSKSLSKDGMTIPEIDLGTLTGKLVVSEGVASLEEPIETESEDLKLSLEGDVKLRDPVKNSSFDMVLKVALTESLLERSDRLAFMYKGASPKAQLDPPENGLGFRLEGSVGRPKFRGIKTKSRRQRLKERREKQREREAKRRQRRAKRESRNNRRKKDDEPKIEEPTRDDEPEEPEEPERGSEDEDENKRIDIEPIDAAPEPEPQEEPPALPPPDEGEEIEVFDPNDPGAEEPMDDPQGNDPGDVDQAPQDGQGAGSGGEAPT